MANLSNINNRFLVTTTGEVLIGQTSNNGNRLQITGADGASYIYLKTDVATTGGRIGFNGDDLRVFNQQAAGDLHLGTNGATKLTIDSSGNATFEAAVTVKSGNKLILNRPNNAIDCELSTDSSGTLILNSRNGEGFKFQNNGTNFVTGDSSGNTTFAGTGTFTSASSYVLTAKSTDTDAADIFRVVADDDGLVASVSKDASDNGEFYVWSGAQAANIQLYGGTGNATFASRVSAGESFNSVKDGADTVADGPFFALKNAAGTRQYINQLDASNNIDYWYYNGSTWTQTISLLNDGGASFGGNVIIGDTSGTSPNSADRFLKIGKSNLQDCSIILQDAVETWEIYQNDDLQFSFGTTPSTVMTMQRTTGNVGIGQTNPQNLLSLSKAGGANIRFDNPTTGRHFVIGEGVGSPDKFSFRGLGYRSTDTMTIDFTNDRVGINEHSPAAKLDVKVASNEHFLVSDSLSTVALKATNDAAAAYVPMSINGSTLTINADSAGKVGIGTASPGAKLEITTAVAGFTTIIENTNGASDANGLLINAGTVQTEYSLRVRNTANTSSYMEVRGDGNITIPLIGVTVGATAIGVDGSGFIRKLSSSKRYKKDIEPIDIGLDFINSLSPVKFKMKEDDAESVGLIAEDMIDNRFVTYSQIDMEDESKGLQVEGVNYQALIAPLIKSIQELKAEIETLKTQINK